ncbi:hypothetical protein ACL7TT_06390 [Microbulbifer sp. 2304DJ12-6]|uniref:hypothetical protein n=1 Tax=Microbulbifer sp. 2304DJ12-6 TaxID=3233340 RepID=UPI0039B089F2
MQKYIISLVMLFCAGCTTPQLRENNDSIPLDENGYIAGSFIHSTRESYARLALELKEKSNSKLTLIELHLPKNYRPIDLVGVKPGIYKINSLTRLAASGGYISKKEININEIESEFEVKPGYIYYIGDYDGQSTNEITSFIVIGAAASASTNHDEALRISGQELNAVKEKILTHYPEFGNLEVLDVFNLNK